MECADQVTFELNNKITSVPSSVISPGVCGGNLAHNTGGHTSGFKRFRISNWHHYSEINDIDLTSITKHLHPLI